MAGEAESDPQRDRAALVPHPTGVHLRPVPHDGGMHKLKRRISVSAWWRMRGRMRPRIAIRPQRSLTSSTMWVDRIPTMFSPICDSRLWKRSRSRVPWLFAGSRRHAARLVSHRSCVISRSDRQTGDDQEQEQADRDRQEVHQQKCGLLPEGLEPSFPVHPPERQKQHGQEDE